MKAIKIVGLIVALMVSAASVMAQQDIAEARQQLNGLLSKKNFDEAAEYVEQVIGESENKIQAVGLRQVLAMSLAENNRFDAAAEQLAKQIDETLSVADPAKQAELGNVLIGIFSGIYRRAGRTNEIIPTIDRIIDWARKGADGDQFSPQRAAIGNMLISKSQNLFFNDQTQAALDILNKELELAKSWCAQEAGESQVGHQLRVLAAICRTTDGEQQENSYQQAMSLVTEQVEAHPEQFNLLTSAATLVSQRAAVLLNDDPDAAQGIIDSFKALVEKATAENDEAKSALSRTLASLGAVENRIASTRKLLKLVGQPAPKFDSEFWVNAKEFDPEQLTGKVVLLDFWAVWCGPCIMTFPHLKHWQEAYGDDGLQIVGVTRKYNYKWDAEAKRAVRAEDEVSVEDETEMLENFMAHHELKHPTMVTPKDSSMWSDFGVSGIPHAVVIDRKGIVRLIKVGSGDANALALEAMIKQCLSEK